MPRRLAIYTTGIKQYRFAFLDGCNTANGDWPEAFGIAKLTNNLNFYYSTNNPSHTRPSVFVGWAVSPGGTNWGNVLASFYFRTQWMFDWQESWQTRTLIQALENGRQTSGWVSSGQLWSSLRVYGYVTMRLDEYNRKGDWQWP
jgi:hypothetical protein